MQRMIILLLLLAAAFPASAMSWAELEEQINAVDAGKTADVIVRQGLIEIVDTVVIYTKLMHENEPDHMLFCPAKGSEMDLGKIIDIIRKQVEIEQAKKMASVQLLLIKGLRREFPCSE